MLDLLLVINYYLTFWLHKEAKNMKADNFFRFSYPKGIQDPVTNTPMSAHPFVRQRAVSDQVVIDRGNFHRICIFITRF